LRKRMDEISDLQKALNDAQTYLFDERQHVLKLYAENDELKIQELEDRRKIQQLLAISQPRHEEITYFKSRAPEKIHRYLPRDSQQSLTKSTGSIGCTSNVTAGSMAAGSAVGGTPMAGSVRVLRTVYLPHEQTDTLLLTIESLRAQLDEQQKLSSQQMQALEEERRTVQEMVSVRAQAERDTIQSHETKVRQLQEALCATTKDYIALKNSVHTQVNDPIIDVVS